MIDCQMDDILLPVTVESNIALSFMALLTFLSRSVDPDELQPFGRFPYLR
jgi:hypothetical protein